MTAKRAKLPLCMRLMSAEHPDVHLVQPAPVLKQGFGKQINFRTHKLIFYEKENLQVVKTTSGVAKPISNRHGHREGGDSKPSILHSFLTSL